MSPRAGNSFSFRSAKPRERGRRKTTASFARLAPKGEADMEAVSLHARREARETFAFLFFKNDRMKQRVRPLCPYNKERMCFV